MRVFLVLIVALAEMFAAEVYGEAFVKNILAQGDPITKCSGGTVIAERLDGQDSIVEEFSKLKELEIDLAMAKIDSNESAITKISSSINNINKKIAALQKSAMSRVTRTTCESDGHFVFDDLPPGDYVIGAIIEYQSISAQGIADAIPYTKISIKDGDKRKHIVIHSDMY